MTTTPQAATATLRAALADVDVDNEVGASTALLSVVGRFRPEAGTQWDAFQLAAEKLLEPWFKDTTQAAVWAVAYQYRNQLAGDRGPNEVDVAASSGARVRCMADVELEEVRWLWHDRIPLGKVSEIVGDPGVGKSTVTLQIVAHATTGRSLPGDEFGGGEYEPINVLLLNAEDGAGDTIRPRLDRAGADVARVHIFDGIETEEGGLVPFNLRDPLHSYYLAGLVADLDIGLLVIDPLNAYLGGVDSHKDADVRGVLAPLAELAESSGCAVLTVRHLNKGSTSRAIYRAGGSIGFTGAARSSMLVGQPDEDSDERALIVIKANLAKFPPRSASRLLTDDSSGRGRRTLPPAICCGPKRTRTSEATECRP